jgi:NAD(P)-dependent dehydrogenase (short-subunit alcohol dehydrogenase family)
MGQIVVTGAAGALGSAVASFLAGKGLQVTGVDLAGEKANFPGSFIGNIDLTSQTGSAEAAAKIRALGPVDGLVNIAGGFRWETVEEGSVDSWEFLFRINVLTAVNITKSLLSDLVATKASVVNIGAAATLKADMGMGAYTASKSGVARFTEALAAELKGKGVRVNALLPSIIDTPANRADMGDADAAKWVRPEELAEAIAFLLSTGASAITGALIPVTGRV